MSARQEWDDTAQKLVHLTVQHDSNAEARGLPAWFWELDDFCNGYSATKVEAFGDGIDCAYDKGLRMVGGDRANGYEFEAIVIAEGGVA